MKASVKGKWFTVEEFLKEGVLLSNEAGEVTVPESAIDEIVSEPQFKKNSRRFLLDVIKKSYTPGTLLEYKPENVGVN